MNNRFMIAQHDAEVRQHLGGGCSFIANLPLRFSWFCFSPGLVSIQSGFKRSRSLSLCFLDLFFLCWPLVNCWSVQTEVSVCGGLGLGAGGAGSVLSSLGTADDPLSLCGEYRPFGLPWRWLLVWSNSILIFALELPWLEELHWEGDCRDKHWFNSLCFLGVSHVDESKGNGRFYRKKKDNTGIDWWAFMLCILECNSYDMYQNIS